MSSLAVILVAVFWVSLLTAVTVYFYPRHVNTLYLQNNYISSSHTDSTPASVRSAAQQQQYNKPYTPTTSTDATTVQPPCPTPEPATCPTCPTVTSPITTAASTTTAADTGMAHFYHMCAPDHIGAQTTAKPRPPLQHGPSTTSQSNHPSTEVDLARLREFDGTGHAYLSADVWPSVSQGNISLQTSANYYRVYVMEFNVDETRRLLTFNIVRETRHAEGWYSYTWVGADLLRWWTNGSPDVQLECAHAYGSDNSTVEQVTDAFVDNDRNPQLHCHYSTTVDLQDRIPTFTMLRFRNKHVGDAPMVYPTSLPEFAGKKWDEVTPTNQHTGSNIMASYV